MSNVIKRDRTYTLDITFAVRMRVSYVSFVPATKDPKSIALA
jgi:hypothetical protein